MALELEVRANTRGFTQGMGLANTATVALGSAIGILVAGGLRNLKDAFGALVERSGELNSVTVGFDGLATSAGLVSDTLLNKMRPATLGMVSDFDLMKQANNAMTLGIVRSEEEFGNLVQGATTLGRTLGIDTLHALESLTIGVGRQSKLVLDNLGIIVDTEAAYKNYAATLGITVSEMDDAEKKTAFLNAAMEAIKTKSAEAGDAQLVLGDRVDQARTAFENWTDTIVAGINESPRFNAALDTMGELFAENGGLAVAFADALVSIVETGAQAAAAIARIADALKDSAHWLAENNPLLKQWLEYLDSNTLASWTDMVAETAAEWGIYGQTVEDQNAIMERNRQLHIDTGGALKNVESNFGKIIPITQALVAEDEKLEEQVLKLNSAFDAFALKYLTTASEQVQVLTGSARDLSASIGALPLPIDQTGTNLHEYTGKVVLAKKETDGLGLSFSDFGEILRTGNRWIDQTISLFLKLIDTQGGLGGFFSSIGGAFKKFFGGGGGGGGGFGLPDLSGIGVQAGTQAGTGFLSTMGSFLGKAANWLPVVGPIIGAFAGPLMNGLKKVWGGIKSLFGGPGEGELAARATVDQINDSLKAIIPTQELISAGSEEWQKNNVAQVNIIMALGGKISDMEGIWARFANASKDPASAAAFAEFWQEKLAAVQAKMAETGMTLEELRKAATKSAKDGSEAHEKSAKKIKDAYGVAQEAIRDDDTLTADQRKLKLDALQQQYAETMEAVKAKTREAKGEISNLGETVELSFSTDVDKIRDDIQRGIGESNPVEVALASEDFFERFARGVRGGLEDAFEDMGI